MQLMEKYRWRLAVLAAVISAYFFIPGVDLFVSTGLGYLRQRDFEGLRLFILSYGLWAPAASIMLMTVQSLVPLVPGLAITITNAWIFGWEYGALYSWTGALCGAMLDFAVARWYGRDLVEKIISSKYLDSVNDFLERYGVAAIFITRLTPIVPFKLISYSAGLTTMKAWRFMAATGIGQAPAIVLYSVLCYSLARSIRATAAMLALMLAAAAIAYCYRRQLLAYLHRNKNS